MARLFTAIELGAEVRERIAACQAELAGAVSSGRTDGLRLVRAAQLHLTLVFLGEIDDARVPVIVDAMTADLPMPPFEIEFASCGVFPQHGPARVLWLGVGTAPVKPPRCLRRWPNGSRAWACLANAGRSRRT